MAKQQIEFNLITCKIDIDIIKLLFLYVWLSDYLSVLTNTDLNKVSVVLVNEKCKMYNQNVIQLLVCNENKKLKKGFM